MFLDPSLAGLMETIMILKIFFLSVFDDGTGCLFFFLEIGSHFFAEFG